jgi:protein subunit release factor B
MGRFPVSQAKEEAIKKRMVRLHVREEDIEEKFIRSSGPGGRHVNATASCVYLHYRPLHIQVKCMITRSRGMNRFLARRILMDKIEEKILGVESAEQKRVYKIKRQKRKRSKRAKEKLLETKHLQSEKKTLRRIGPSDLD